jgi:hypothetical protein
MTHRNPEGSSSKKPLFTGLILACMTAIASAPAHSAGAPVNSSVANKKLAELNATTKQNLDEQAKQTKGMEALNAAVGAAGSGMSILKDPAWEAMGSQSDFYKNMEKFGFDMCAINLCQVGKNPVSTTDIDEARDWANKTFFASVELDSDTYNDLTEVRRRAVAYATTNAFAVSTIVHNELAAGGGSAQALEEIVDSAGSYRKDIQANSAVALANYKVAIQQLAVLSSMLDVQAAQAILDASVYHEEGATEFPDAYIASDYDHGNRRHTVTAPDKGSPD